MDVVELARNLVPEDEVTIQTRQKERTLVVEKRYQNPSKLKEVDFEGMNPRAAKSEGGASILLSGYGTTYLLDVWENFGVMEDTVPRATLLWPSARSSKRVQSINRISEGPAIQSDMSAAEFLWTKTDEHSIR